MRYSMEKDNENIINKLKSESVVTRIETIKKYKELAKEVIEDPNWKVRYAAINNNYALPIQTIQKYAFDKDERVSSKAKYMLDMLSKYVYREDIEDTISIKLVIPGGCNAKCFFCYGDGYTCQNTKEMQEKFIQNFLNSLEEIIVGCDENKKISLDITGGEPTLDSEFLIKVLNKLRSFYLLPRLEKVTLTSNGLKLKEVAHALKGVVNYVNISIHHYDKIERDRIFGAKTFTDEEYKEMVLKLIDNNIQPSAVVIVYKEDKNFSEFRDRMIGWAEEIGFNGIRFRKNVYWDDKKLFMNYVNDTIKNGEYTYIEGRDTTYLTWCKLKNKTDFLVYFISGVEDTTQMSLGMEFVVNDDGIGYVDFNKKQRIADYPLPLGLTFDVKV